jgi:hypothetical protein
MSVIATSTLTQPGRAPVLCVECGYGLEGLHTAAGRVLCPECGVEMKVEDARALRAPSWGKLAWKLSGPAFLQCSVTFLLFLLLRVTHAGIVGGLFAMAVIVSILFSVISPFLAGPAVAGDHFPRQRKLAIGLQLTLLGLVLNFVIAVVYLGLAALISAGTP